MTRWTIGLLICGVSIAASYYFIDRRLLISLKVSYLQQASPGAQQ
jgi:hypothetical protein